MMTFDCFVFNISNTQSVESGYHVLPCGCYAYVLGWFSTLFFSIDYVFKMFQITKFNMVTILNKPWPCQHNPAKNILKSRIYLFCRSSRGGGGFKCFKAFAIRGKGTSCRFTIHPWILYNSNKIPLDTVDTVSRVLVNFLAFSSWRNSDKEYIFLSMILRPFPPNLKLRPQRQFSGVKLSRLGGGKVWGLGAIAPSSNVKKAALPTYQSKHFVPERINFLAASSIVLYTILLYTIVSKNSNFWLLFGNRAVTHTYHT